MLFSPATQCGFFSDILHSHFRCWHIRPQEVLQVSRVVRQVRRGREEGLLHHRPGQDICIAAVLMAVFNLHLPGLNLVDDGLF